MVTGGLVEALRAMPDPELPVLTIADLGILRDVAINDGHVTVTITPTYSGCPAMDMIRGDIARMCAEHGWTDVEVRTALSPAWTTDWITDAGRRKLRDHGVAPPPPSRPVFVELAVRCPRCGSPDTREVSRFGPTPCTSLRACNACREPFEHVKAI